MTHWGRLIWRALVPVVVAGLLVPLAATTPAGAVTSYGSVRSELFLRAGEAWFYSGNDGGHGKKGGAGFNSFILADLDCADGLTIGVSWSAGGRGGRMEIPKDGCENGQREYGFEISRPPREITPMSWYLWAKDSDGNVRHQGAAQTDWLGSLSEGIDPGNPTGTYFGVTSVYNDEYHGDLGITASVWPTEQTKKTILFAPQQLNEMWDELNRRTPLPDHFTSAQVESMYKQFVCHAQAAYIAEEVGAKIGDSWDFESWRPNISWKDVFWNIRDHECNWGDDDGDYDSNIPPGHFPDDQPPVVNAGPDVAGDEGAAVTLQGSAVDELGQPDTRWTYEPLKGVDAGAACSFADKNQPTTTVTCTDDGQYRVTLTGDDGVNAPVSDSAVLTVRNVAPTLSLKAPENWAVYRVENEVTLDASFTDPGTNDTHVCTVSWDDGTTEEFATQDGKCRRTRTFDHAGMYTTTLTVTDDDGGADSAETMVVVYDPRAGLLTATGQVEDSTAFAMVAKYLTTDSTHPFGEFAVSAPTAGGDRLTFATTSLEWLVITPDGKSAIKGTAGDYGFVAYATPAGFRGVVWPLSAGKIPPPERLYDTSPAAEYDVDVADPKPLTTGAIVIDSGWVPGLPLPLGEVLDNVRPEVELTGLPANSRNIQRNSR